MTDTARSIAVIVDATAGLRALCESGKLNQVAIPQLETEGREYIEMGNFNRSRISGLAIAVMAGALGVAGLTGQQAITAFTNMSDGLSFGQRYGANPRSTGNGGYRHSYAAQKRAKNRRRNIAKHNKSAHRGGQ